MDGILLLEREVQLLEVELKEAHRHVGALSERLRDLRQELYRLKAQASDHLLQEKGWEVRTGHRVGSVGSDSASVLFVVCATYLPPIVCIVVGSCWSCVVEVNNQGRDEYWSPYIEMSKDNGFYGWGPTKEDAIITALELSVEC